MRRQIQGSLLRGLKGAGVFDRVRDSRWRRRQLLILCYHSFALDQENQWRPALFLTQSRLRERFELLKQGGYRVLPLGEALERMRRTDLPERSVALTFDDGTYDFHQLAYPLLKEYNFPATVYQTTYYCAHRMPVFNVICAYMMWKRRDVVLSADPSLGILQDFHLQESSARDAAVRQMVAFANEQQFSADDRNKLAAALAARIGVDYGEIVRKRILQLMTASEIGDLAAAGINFELHTHRHRTPRDRGLFVREIRDNRAALEAMSRTRTSHFCYPSGDSDPMFLPWLAQEGVTSATTCIPGLAKANSEPLLLPRFIDTTGKTELEFESWLTGVAGLLQAGVNAAKLRSFSRS